MPNKCILSSILWRLTVLPDDLLFMRSPDLLLPGKKV